MLPVQHCLGIGYSWRFVFEVDRGKVLAAPWEVKLVLSDATPRHATPRGAWGALLMDRPDEVMTQNPVDIDKNAAFFAKSSRDEFGGGWAVVTGQGGDVIALAVALERRRRRGGLCRSRLAPLLGLARRADTGVACRDSILQCVIWAAAAGVGRGKARRGGERQPPP